MATSKVLADAKVIHVTPSATRASFTKGPSPEATDYFFRVVADDSVQGTVDAKYMIKKGAKKVTIFDGQEPYSVGLANYAEARLKKGGVAVQRQSTTNSQTDFSSNVTRIPADTDFVFAPLQVAANTNQIAVLLKEQGKKAIVFGGDGDVDPAFKTPGSLVSNFAPDLSADPTRKAVLDAWKKDNPDRTLSPFGPPSYGAVQAILHSVARVCAKKKTVSRADVRNKMKVGVIPNWILGGKFRFSTKTNDPLNGGFWLYQIQSDGSLKSLGKLT